MFLTPPRKPWNAQEDYQLDVFWEAGLSVDRIAEIMGRSRGAVCGRRKRLALPERGCPLPKAKPCPQYQREYQAGLDAARAELERL